MFLEPNWAYQFLLKGVKTHGQRVFTRNAYAYSWLSAPRINFVSPPLVVVRKTAWRKAIQEMAWFISGDPKCPENLMDWWGNQLSPDGFYLGGYGDQWHRDGFNQIEYFYETLKNHPNSRRAVITTWNTKDMAGITLTNQNALTPSTCHGTVLQGWVRGTRLYLSTYQRSADILLGVPHNWIQYWALGVWLAHRLDCYMYSLQWAFGDLHLYDEPSHIEIADKIIALEYPTPYYSELIYEGSKDTFEPSKFSFDSRIPEPSVSGRPKLL